MSDVPESPPGQDYLPEKGAKSGDGDIDPRQTKPIEDLEDTAPIKVTRPPAPPPGFAAAGPKPAGSSTRPTGNKPSDAPSPPAGFTSGTVLPRRVDEVDINATRVTPAAYRSETPAPQTLRPRSGRAPSPAEPPALPPPTKSNRYNKPNIRRPVDTSRRRSCMFRGLFISLFLAVVAGLCVLSLAFYQYYRIARTLPNISDLRQRASQFETTRILDRDGNLLYEILDPTAGRRTYIPLEKISPYLVAATIATEDKGFYSHPGFDIVAIARAFTQNTQAGGIASGASTITQQLARTLLFTPEERVEQSYSRKLREAILAAEITRRYSKDDILELYLNEIYFGNLAYGIEAAAETYFGATADKLTFGQASFLAGLPQAPSVYDIYSNPEATFQRHEDVLVLMYQLSLEEGCIFVSNSPQKVCVDPVAVTIAASEMREHEFQSPDIDIRYPHWVNYVRSQLETLFDPQTIYRSGFTVYTTLAPALQDQAQAAVSEQVASMAGQNASNGALIMIRPGNGEILAMVGSADFYNEAISGQVNMAISPRQPGSAIKPLTYVAAFEKGWTPATLIWDVPSEFPPSGRPDDTRPPYKPVNYDGKFHGPVSLRTALANSYNIPAVKALEFVGIYDDPGTPETEGLISFAERLGVTTLTRPDYGLSLTLGGGEVTLLELTGAYATFANNGRRIKPVSITRILDNSGEVVYEITQSDAEQVLRAEHTFLINSILSDNDARTPAFGRSSILNLPFAAAAKTGTTNDFRDNWTVGYTPDIAVGVWVGNADYTPMINTSGLSGAAPIWAKVMQAAVDQIVGGNSTPFVRPGGVVDRVVCEVSGTLPSQWCPKQRTDFFAADQPPLAKEFDLWQKVLIDTWTGLRASAACPEFTDEKFVMNVVDQWAKKWIRQDSQGRSWADSIGFSPPVTFAPSRECRGDDPRPRLSFTAPGQNETITTSPLGIYAIVDASVGFDNWRLEAGRGELPVQWEILIQSRDRFNSPALIYPWDLSFLPPDRYTLRLTLFSNEETYAEISLRINIQVPTPTVPPIPTDTPTSTSTMTQMPTNTVLPTSTPTPTTTPSPTVSPTSFLPTLPTIVLP